jgi:hypothetical protein
MTEPSIVTDGGISPPPPPTGTLWHTIRTGPTTAGEWTPLDELNVVIPVAGPAAAVAGAADQAAGEAQYIYTTGGGTSLWHTIRYYGGGWCQPGLVNNQIHIPGPVAAVAGAGDGVPLEAQYMFTTDDGKLWHTIRRADGTWTPTGSVNGQITIPGPVSAIAAAGDGILGETQFLYTTGGGASLWHTIRYADGTWATPDLLNNKFTIPNPVTAVSASGDGLPGEAQFVIVFGGMLWHTIRTAAATNNWSGLGCVNHQFQPNMPAQPPVQAVAAAYDYTSGEVQFIFAKNDGSAWHTARNSYGGWEPLDNLDSLLNIPGPVTALTATGDGLDAEAQFMVILGPLQP